MPDPNQPQAQAPDLNATIAQLLQSLQGAANMQVPQPQGVTQEQLDATRPGLLARIGEAVGGGPPSDYPMTQAQREASGRRSLFNFGLGLLGGGTFDTIGQTLAGGLVSAERSQLGNEALAAGRQQAAQDWQQQQMQNRISALKEMVPLLQLGARVNMPGLYGPGTPPDASRAGALPGPVGGGPAFTGDPAKDLPMIAQRESGGDPTALNYVARADPTAYARGATASGKYQIVNSTWAEGMKLAGVDPSKYPTAMSAPESVQDTVAKALYDKYGSAPWDPTKFKQNWVPTPTGQFILAHAVPSGDGKTPPPAAPGAVTAANAPPGVQVGGSAPPPPDAAPGAAPGPIGIGAALNTRQGPDQYTVAPPPVVKAAPVPAGNLQTTGKPPGTAAIDAIQAGRALARADMAPPGTVATAGPGAGTPPATTTAPAPQPGWGTVVGSYDNAPRGAVPPVVPAQPTPQPPAAQPAPTPPAPPARDIMAKNPDGSWVIPDDKLGSVLDYQQRNAHIYSPQELAQQGITVPLNSTALQTAYEGVTKADSDLAAARQVAEEARRGFGGQGMTVDGALKAVNTAETAEQAARQNYTKAIQDADEANAGRLATLYSQQRQQLADAYKAQVTDPANTARQQQQASDLKIKEGLVAAGTADDQKVLQGIDATTESAHDTLSTLETAKQLSLAAGNKSALAVVAPGLATMLQRSGLLSQDESNKLDAQKALDGVLSKMAGTMRTSMGFSRMTNMDLQFLQNMVGTSNIPESQRNAMFGFMQTALERQYQYGALVRELYGGGPNAGGMTLAKAREAADDKLGHIVQTVPNGLPPDQGDLFVQQHVSPGTFYVRDGQLRIRGQ